MTIVPEGLILLTSLTFAVAALRMARRGALAQQLNAIESLASVDLVCLDKTGTLTESSLRVLELVPAEGVDPTSSREALARFAGSASANSTLGAIRESSPHHPGRPRPRCRSRHGGAGAGSTSTGSPSARRTRAVRPRPTRRARLAGRARRPPGPRLRHHPGVVRSCSRRQTARRHDVARPRRPRRAAPARDARDDRVLPLTGRRPEDPFRRSPETVAAIARDVGIPGEEPPVDGEQLPENPAELRRAVLASPVVGRISPQESGM